MACCRSQKATEEEERYGFKTKPTPNTRTTNHTYTNINTHSPTHNHHLYNTDSQEMRASFVLSRQLLSFLTVSLLTGPIFLFRSFLSLSRSICLFLPFLFSFSRLKHLSYRFLMSFGSILLSLFDLGLPVMICIESFHFDCDWIFFSIQYFFLSLFLFYLSFWDACMI